MESKGFALTDEEMEWCKSHASAKMALTGKDGDSDYFPLLLEDVIKEFCIRKEINHVSIGIMLIRKEEENHGSDYNERVAYNCPERLN